MKTLRCSCCDKSIQYEDPKEAGDVGWVAIPNTANGLVFEFTCPVHTEELRGAMREILRLFGKKAANLHFTSLLRRMMSET